MKKLKQEKKKHHKKILAILIGPPGSGKSYYCQHTLYNYFRISQDNFGKGHYRKFLEILLSGMDLIVIDRMNFSIQQRLQYVLPAQKFGYKIMYYFFVAPESICLKRMKERKNHPTIKNNDHETQKKVLKFFQDKYEEPGDLENFDMTEIKTGEENDQRNQKT
jgi:predicted kinase